MPVDLVLPSLACTVAIVSLPSALLGCDRLGLRPGAVSLVEKAQKPSQLALDVDAKPEVSTKYDKG